MVECNLAKVEVAGSNPVSRSKIGYPSESWRHSQVAKAAVCKTVILRFKSGCRLHFLNSVPSFHLSMKPIRVLIFFLLSILFSSSLWGQENPNPTPIVWQTLSPGLSFLRWEVRLANNSNKNTLMILRIDPELWSFRVFFDKEPKTIKEWHLMTKATVTCNGGFYQENFQPAGRILVDGTSLGPFRNRHMKGMFLSEPKKGFEHLSKATLIDLKEKNSEEKISSYDQGIQSFPVLLDPTGLVRVNPSNFQANRTVLAQDHFGNIYILITEKPFFTLYDLGHYLKGLPFGFRFILNLDGGLRTQLMIQVKTFHYFFTSQGEGGETSRLFFPELVKLPSVIGIFPREHH